LKKWVSFVKGLPQDFKILFRAANAHANGLNAAAPLSLSFPDGISNRTTVDTPNGDLSPKKIVLPSATCRVERAAVRAIRRARRATGVLGMISVDCETSRLSELLLHAAQLFRREEARVVADEARTVAIRTDL